MGRDKHYWLSSVVSGWYQLFNYSFTVSHVKVGGLHAINAVIGLRSERYRYKP